MESRVWEMVLALAETHGFSPTGFHPPAGAEIQGAEHHQLLGVTQGKEEKQPRRARAEVSRQSSAHGPFFLSGTLS